MQEYKYTFICNECNQKYPCVIKSPDSVTPESCPYTTHKEYEGVDSEFAKWESID